MKLNLKRPLVIFDLETTGLDIVKDRIIQIAYIKVHPDGKEERKSHFVNPGMPIPKEVTEITHITNDNVANAPTFKQLASQLQSVFEGCDFAGFNSNHFDIPLLAEEFLRAGIDFDFSKCRMIDVQTIFHKMEPRNLEAAYAFYCGGDMKKDFPPHQADNDTEVTYRVLQGQLDMYSPSRQESADRQLKNDVEALAAFLEKKTNNNVDFAGRFIWKETVDATGKKVRQEVFNFGKYKGIPVVDVLRRDPGYYGWMLNGDFTYNTKQVLTRIRLREFNNH
ncbi:MAG: 3'-5' exonuclease [Prevotella sp.]|nr:3'-5' exonuclease [Prevotella sp.]